MMKRLLFLLLIPAIAFPQAVKYTSQFRGGQIDTILTQAQHIPSPVWNVKNAPFNAKGDGATDDQPAIQRAIDSASVGGGVVYFPEGTYKLTGFIDTAYTTRDSVAAPVGYPTSFTTSNIHLRDTSSNVKFVGAGRGVSIITSDVPSIQLLISRTNKDSLLSGIEVSGLEFRYTGGYLGQRHGGAYGVFILGSQAKVTNCDFKNFLNSVIIARNSTDCNVSENTGSAEHGRASCSYPLYPSRDTGSVYWGHPAVFIRNYGTRTHITGNVYDGLTNLDFSSVACPDSFKIQMDGLLHGSATGTLLIGNAVTHFCQEGYYVEEGQRPVSDAITVIQGNLADGYIGTMTGAAPLSLGTRKVFGRWGIRSDSWNASITGNVIRNVSAVGILVACQTLHPENITITGNTISNAARGIRLDSVKYSTVSGNTIAGIVPTQAQKDSGLFFERGIDVYRSSKININGNSVYGNHSSWYLSQTVANAQSDSGTTRIYMASSTGIAVGDWLYAHYSPSEPDGGERYYIDSVGTDYARATSIVYKTISIGDTLHFVKATVDQYGNDGVVLNESDSCQVVSNTFVSCANPIWGMGTTHSGGSNVYLNCIKDPTGGLPVRFSLIGGATPISTTGSITTTAGLSGQYLLLQPWYHIATTTGAFYLRPGSGQVAMYDGSTSHYQFDIYNGATQRISFRGDDSSFILGKLGVGTAWPDSQMTAAGIHSTGGLKVDGSVTIGGSLIASSISGDTSAAWGTITGNVADQTDLMTEIHTSINDSLDAERAKIRTIGYCGLIDTMYTSDTVDIDWVGPATTITSIIYSGGRDISLTARIELVDSILQTDGVELVDTTTCIGQKTVRSSAVAGGTFTLTEGKLLRLVFDMMDTPPKIFSVTIKGKE